MRAVARTVGIHPKMKLIQVTDCHMRAAEDTIHWGYRPQASLAAVLDAAAAA
eukprot:COSAG04_NODE_235_length_19140_cov_47.925109_17_plen_52_part_00